ncbi:MAG: cysteine--tRNA ligase [Myxococcota bacterium]
MPAPFRLYNTRTRRVEPFEPLVAGQVGLYVCGMTVYAECHIGHARAMVVFDTFARYLAHRGWTVRFVRNFTDVDDKIIVRAQEHGEDPLVWAQTYIDHFHRDMRDLGLADPTLEPRVTTSIPKIVELIGMLVERGNAYPSEGSVWFDVPSWRTYGALSGQQVDELRSEDPGSGKRHPADFALWKAAKPGEPAWPSPWGDGRPGWHVECSAMAWDTLGATIDIHGGGLDLVFPHHENEVAQSECAHGAVYARYWMHNGLLTLASGVKMGKSKGNVVEIHHALRELPAEALRLYYLQNHYRSQLPYDAEALSDALAMLARLYDAREVAEKMRGDDDADAIARALGADALTVLDLGRRFPELLYQALDDDFNTSMALGHAFELARAINRLSNHKKAAAKAGPVVAPALAALALLGPTLGLLGASSEAFQTEVKAKRLPLLGITAPQVDALIQARADARANKDWARADEIRAELEGHRIAVMDRSDGSDWKVRLTISAEP